VTLEPFTGHHRMVIFVMLSRKTSPTPARDQKGRIQSSMTTLRMRCLLFLIWVAPAVAQSQFQAGSPPAASGPDYNLSAGYSYMTLGVPALGHVNLNGVDAAAHVDFNPRFGATMDANYAATPNISGTPHSAYALTLQAGPVFYFRRRATSRMFLHPLFGAGLVDGAFPVGSQQYFHGWLLRPSYAFGGGMEQSVAGPFAVRLSGDFVRTTFFNYTGGVQPQNGFRATVSFVWRVRERLSSSY